MKRPIVDLLLGHHAHSLHAHRREKEGLRRAHEKALESLREQYETGQEGWRASVAERAKRELAEKEAALKDHLTRERDAQLEVGMLCGKRAEQGSIFPVLESLEAAKVSSCISRHNLHLKKRAMGLTGG